MPQSTLCRPPAATGGAPAVVASAKPGQGVGSNLDASGRLIIKKGATVSYGGLRYIVARIRLGRIWAYPVRWRFGADFNVETVQLSARAVVVVQP